MTNNVQEPEVKEPEIKDNYKYTLENIIRSFGPVTLISYLIYLRIIPAEVGFINGVLQVIGIGLYSYFLHRLIHILPDHPLNYHVYSHHNKQFNLSRNVELFIEFIHNLMCFLPIFIIQSLTGIDNTILIFVAFWYSSVHIIDMSIIPCVEHTNHHIDSSCNYGPSIFDFMFGTLKVEEGYTADSQALCGVILYILYDIIDKYKN